MVMTKHFSSSCKSSPLLIQTSESPQHRHHRSPSLPILIPIERQIKNPNSWRFDMNNFHFLYMYPVNYDTALYVSQSPRSRIFVWIIFIYLFRYVLLNTLINYADNRFLFLLKMLHAWTSIRSTWKNYSILVTSEAYHCCFTFFICHYRYCMHQLLLLGRRINPLKECNE